MKAYAQNCLLNFEHNVFLKITFVLRTKNKMAAIVTPEQAQAAAIVSGKIVWAAFGAALGLVKSGSG